MRYSPHIIAAAAALATLASAQQLQPLPGEGATATAGELIPLPTDGGAGAAAEATTTTAAELAPLPAETTAEEAAATAATSTEETAVVEETTTAEAAAEETAGVPSGGDGVQLISDVGEGAAEEATATTAEFKTPLTKGVAASNTQPPYPIPSEYAAAGWAGASGEIMTIPGTAIQSGSMVTSVLVTATAQPSSGLGSGSGSGSGNAGGASGGVGVGDGSPTTTGDAAGVTQVPIGGARGAGLDSGSVVWGVAVGVVAWGLVV